MAFRTCDVIKGIGSNELYLAINHLATKTIFGNKNKSTKYLITLTMFQLLNI